MSYFSRTGAGYWKCVTIWAGGSADGADVADAPSCGSGAAGVGTGSLVSEAAVSGPTASVCSRALATSGAGAGMGSAGSSGAGGLGAGTGLGRLRGGGAGAAVGTGGAATMRVVKACAGAVCWLACDASASTASDSSAQWTPNTTRVSRHSVARGRRACGGGRVVGCVGGWGINRIGPRGLACGEGAV